MLKQAKKDVSSLRNRSILNVLGMLGSFLGVAVLWLFFDFTSYWTHIGISLILLSILIYTLMLYLNHRTISQKDFTQNPSEFLQSLKSYQIERQNLNDKLYWFYACFLSIGLAMYFIEVLKNFDVLTKSLIILLTFGWIVFSSTFLRKSIVKKDKERIAKLIQQFEKINSQINQKD
jgi:hypothetical protein